MLGTQRIKIINNRNVVFIEFEMPCLKHKTDKSSKSEMKLTRFNLSQPENNKVEPANPLTEENKVNYEVKEVSQPQVANEPQTIVEYEIYVDSNIDPSISNYQLVKDRERRQSKPNPRCEI